MPNCIGPQMKLRVVGPKVHQEHKVTMLQRYGAHKEAFMRARGGAHLAAVHGACGLAHRLFSEPQGACRARVASEC